MGSNSYITDKLTNEPASTHKGRAHTDKQGLMTYTQPFREYVSKSIVLTNDDGSPNMNVDASVSGATDGIHDGTDSVLWTGTALGGTWDFASTAQAQAGTKSIDATATVNGDQAQLERSSSTPSSSWEVITGWVYLTSYNASKHEILLQWMLAGVADGSTLDLGTYINTGTTGAWQSFTIPLSDFGVSGPIDQLIITTTVTTGAAPNYYLDELDFRASGSVVYTGEPDKKTTFEFDEMDLIITDNVTGITAVAGATENATGHSLSYDKFMGLTALANGVTLRQTRLGVVLFSVTFRNLSDILFTAFDLITQVSDGTNTIIKIRGRLSTFVLLEEEKGDKVEIVISDDLSGLLQFKALLRGRELLNGQNT